MICLLITQFIGVANSKCMSKLCCVAELNFGVGVGLFLQGAELAGPVDLASKGQHADSDIGCFMFGHNDFSGVLA